MHLLHTLNLGDMIELPTGQKITVRARVRLPETVGAMRGFIICGELEILLGIPENSGETIVGYRRIKTLPKFIKNVQAIFKGACSYWAPHLPGMRQAMGELLYKVLEVPGSIDPIVIVWRGQEAVIFVKGESYKGDMRVLYMPRHSENLDSLDWTSSEVLPLPAVYTVPEEIEEFVKPPILTTRPGKTFIL